MSRLKVYSCTDLIWYQAEERAKEILDRLKQESESTNTPLLSLEGSSRKVLLSKTIQELTLKLVAEMHKDGEKGLVAMDSYGYPIKLISIEDTLAKLSKVYLSPTAANTWLGGAEYPNKWNPQTIEQDKKIPAGSQEDWVNEVRAIADKIALTKWNMGMQEITQHNICKAVAIELGKDPKMHGSRGPRAASSVRNALKGWKFIPPKLAQMAQMEQAEI